MHPDRRFRAERDWLDFADARGFAHIFAATPDGPMVAHAPVSRVGAALHFHISRANRMIDHLEGASIVVSVADADGYISPNWYQSPGNQVPTWNYAAVELTGTVRRIDEDALIAQLDALAARHEPRVNPAAPWRRDKMDAAAFTALLRGITGFAVTVTAVHETVKLSQNKPPTDRAGVVSGLRASGNDALAQAMADA